MSLKSRALVSESLNTLSLYYVYKFLQFDEILHCRHVSRLFFEVTKILMKNGEMTKRIFAALRKKFDGCSFLDEKDEYSKEEKKNKSFFNAFVDGLRQDCGFI